MMGADIVRILRAGRLAASTEAALQQSIADALTAADVSFQAEVIIGPGSRIDFLAAGGIGIEAKLRYPRRDIWRQLSRYAGCEPIQSLILVSGTPIGLPATINDTPVYFVSIGRGAL